MFEKDIVSQVNYGETFSLMLPQPRRSAVSVKAHYAYRVRGCIEMMPTWGVRMKLDGQCEKNAADG